MTVHGRGVAVDLDEPGAAGLRKALLDLYVPRYGPDWERFMSRAQYIRIAATRMFAFRAGD